MFLVFSLSPHPTKKQTSNFLLSAGKGVSPLPCTHLPVATSSQPSQGLVWSFLIFVKCFEFCWHSKKLPQRWRHQQNTAPRGAALTPWNLHWKVGCHVMCMNLKIWRKSEQGEGGYSQKCGTSGHDWHVSEKGLERGLKEGEREGLLQRHRTPKPPAFHQSLRTHVFYKPPFTARQKLNFPLCKNESKKSNIHTYTQHK